MSASAALGLAPLCAVLAWAAARRMIVYAERLKLVQAPNERSSHTVPTPRGGGAGIVVSATLAAAALRMSGQAVDATVVALALLIAAVGLWDDLRSLSSGLRLAAQAGAAGLLLMHVGAMPPLEFAAAIPTRGLVWMALAALVLVWWINLFNFMDGIDGLASTQAIYLLVGALALSVYAHPQRLLEADAIWMVSLAAAVAGFLTLNWPPAKIFMGDVGSTYLGFVIAAIALLTIRDGWLPYSAWLVLAAVFVTDASITLLLRIARREPLDQAHRNHAYQRLARALRSHRSVTMLYLGINLAWLLPIAWGTVRWPQRAAPLLALAYLPLIVLTLWVQVRDPRPRKPD